MRVRFPRAAVALLAAVALVPAASAGVVNPDVSLIGQPTARWTDDPFSPGRRRWVLDAGETELMLDAPLNPYARGAAVFSFAGNGVSVEEAYFLLERGLPAGLALKGGRYRAGFGKLNPSHPHAWPFADRPRVLAAYLPGAESFAETGVQLSEQVALPHDVALTLAGDWLQGDSFRVMRDTTALAAGDPLRTAAGDRADEPRPAALGRASAFVPIGDRSGLELGTSWTQGTNNVAAATRTTVWGADAKLKYWTGASAYVLAQAEYLALDRENASWDAARAAYASASARPGGGYAFVDWNFDARHDAGAWAERYQDPGAGGAAASGFGVFAGLALMEETTSFRIGWDRHAPAHTAGAPASGAVQTITLRVLYSMGPHKAHQF